MTLLAPPPPTKMTPPPPRRVTPEELLEMADNGSLELVDGELVEKNVSLASADVEGVTYKLLDARASETKQAKVFVASLGYRCFTDDPDRVRKPDATVVRIERIRALPESDPGYMPIVPDLAVEVVSKNDRTHKVSEKVKEYLDAGFPLVWVLDPTLRTLVVYPKGGKPTLLSGDDEATCESALPGFRCKVDDFFAGL